MMVKSMAYGQNSELAALVAENAALAAEVERLEGELADANAAYEREREHCVEVMAINDRLTTDAAEATIAADLLEAELADETERLENEASMFQQTITDMESERDTLRAQLDAGGGWRAVTEPPDPSDWVQVRGRGRRSPSGLWAVGIQEWRPLPAPPQE